MTFVQEFSAHLDAAGTSVGVTVPAGGIAIGDYLVLGVGTNAVSLPVTTVTDSAGNVWSNDGETMAATSGSGHQWHTKVTSTLAAGATITVGFPSLSRVAVQVLHFSDTITAVDAGATGNNGGVSSASPTTASFNTVAANCLIVGTLALVSSARILTAGAGYTAASKIVTLAGSGNRAVQMEYRTVAVAGAYVANGTLDSGSIYAMIGRAYEIAGAPPPTGNFVGWGVPL